MTWYTVADVMHFVLSQGTADADSVQCAASSHALQSTGAHYLVL